MNSKQRRNERVYEHEVTLICHNDERYFEFECRVERAKGWLQWKTKRNMYKLTPPKYDRQTFKFRNPSMAALFALKWL